MTDILSKLAAPFPPDVVSWRVGSTNGDKTRGMALAYIDARDVMRRLDEAVGPENWQCDYPWSDGKRVVCRIGIRIENEWIWKTDGAGDTDYEGDKGALSDAFKRSAVKWGIGRYLYDVDSPWVAIEAHGKSYSIKEGELPKLRAKLGVASGVRAPEKQPAPKQPEIAFDAKAEAQAIKALFDKCQNIDQLNLWVEDTILRRKKLPVVTQDWFTKLFQDKLDNFMGKGKAA
jgi:hypothetical protein